MSTRYRRDVRTSYAVIGSRDYTTSPDAIHPGAVMHKTSIVGHVSRWLQCRLCPLIKDLQRMLRGPI